MNIRSNNFYPPSNNQLGWLFIKLTIFIIVLLGLSYTYKEWISNTLPDWNGVFLLLLAIIITMWFYNINKLWLFNWNLNEVKVLLRQNMLLFTRADIWINNNLILSHSVWGSKPIEIDKEIIYNKQNLLLNLKIKKTKEWYKVGCSISIDEQPLIIKD